MLSRDPIEAGLGSIAEDPVGPKGRILMGCGNHYTASSQVGSQHLARAFASLGWKIAYVSNPISPLHLFARDREQLRERFRLHRGGGKFFARGDIWAYVPGALLSSRNAFGLRSYWLASNWNRISICSVPALLRERGFESVDLLYLDSVFHAYLLDRVSYRRMIYRMADRLSAFPGIPKAAEDLEREVIRRADIVFATSMDLARAAVAAGAKRVEYLPNGVDADRFKGDVPDEPSEYASIPHPRAIYVGSLDEWVDFRLLQHVASELNWMSFVLIGPSQLAKRCLPNMPNIHFLGKRCYLDVPAYLRHADIGLIPFDVDGHRSLIDGVNPLKLLEYLCAGLPVVATSWKTIEALGSPAILCRSRVEYVNALRAVHANPPRRDYGQMYVASNSWRSRAHQLLSAAFRE